MRRATSTPKHRVLVWGSGFVGKLVIRELLDHPRFLLAGVLVHDEKKHEVDVGELLGIAPIGMRATRDIDAALALPADAVALLRPDGDVPARKSLEHVARPACEKVRGRNGDDAARLPRRLSRIHHRAARSCVP